MNTKYDRIGEGYNQTRKADPYLVKKLIEHLNPRSYGLYLDIGCGTGNYTTALYAKGVRLIGIDPSAGMLSKARNANLNVDWRQGSCTATGLDDQSVDGIVATLTIHHWDDLKEGFRELHRVLKADGRLVIFTSTPEQMEGYWLNHYWPNLIRKAIEQMPSFHKVENALHAAGFRVAQIENYSVKPDLQDLFLYSGKANPELYFRKDVRNGISTFADLANHKEVEAGLAELRVDIDENRIEEILKSYENNDGDYLYIVAKKLPSQAL